MAAPSSRLAIGNERVVSVWPARTGTIVKAEKLYFTVGVWPFEGTMLYELDATTGKELRVIDLGDHSPQGYLAANQSSIFIPGGRSRAYVVDLETGERASFSYDSKGLNDYHVTANDQHLFHGDRVFALGNESPQPYGLPFRRGQ